MIELHDDSKHVEPKQTAVQSSARNGACRRDYEERDSTDKYIFLVSISKLKKKEPEFSTKKQMTVLERAHPTAEATS